MKPFVLLLLFLCSLGTALPAQQDSILWTDHYFGPPIGGTFDDSILTYTRVITNQQDYDSLIARLRPKPDLSLDWTQGAVGVKSYCPYCLRCGPMREGCHRNACTATFTLYWYPKKP